MGRTQTKGVWEQDPEENIWTEERRRDRRVDKLHKEELRDLYPSSIIRIISPGE
jgi:hypothetical protein